MAKVKIAKLETAKQEAEETERERREAEQANAGDWSAEKRASKAHEADEWKSLLNWARSIPRGPGIPKSLTVVDLCTGTGCIPLLFAHELFSQPGLSKMNARFIGADISTTALELANENLKLQRASQSPAFRVVKDVFVHDPLRHVHFLRADLLADTFTEAFHKHYRTTQSTYDVKGDIMISNPPYISSEEYMNTTSRSVTRYEPRLALVPPGEKSEHDGDLFYPRLLEEAKQLEAKIFLFEVADMEQARRVADLAIMQDIWDGVEIWRDDPAAWPEKGEVVDIIGRDVKVLGEGHGRSVVAYRGEGGEWLGRRRREGR